MDQMDLLRQYSLPLAEEYGSLFLDGRPIDGLRPDEEAIIALAVYASYGSERDVMDQGKKALEAGASPLAIVEAVLTAAISRGPRVLENALPFVSSLSIPVDADGFAPMQVAADYFIRELGELPEWARRLQEFSPDSLMSYGRLRSSLLADGAASRKTKELLTMLLNAIANNASGVRSHACGAIQCAATREEVLAVLLLGIRVAGIVVWINGISAFPAEFDEWFVASRAPGRGDEE